MSLGLLIAFSLAQLLLGVYAARWRLRKKAIAVAISVSVILTALLVGTMTVTLLINVHRCCPTEKIGR
jgi:biotin transporter BioY